MAITTDQVLARRRVLFTSFLVGWVAWYGFLILRGTGLRDLWGPVVDIGIGVVGIGGWFVFAFSLFRIMTIRRQYKDDPEALAALADELSAHHSNQANRNGIFALLGIQVLLVVFDPLLSWSAVAGAQANIFFGVIAIIGSFLWYDLKD